MKFLVVILLVFVIGCIVNCFCGRFDGPNTVPVITVGSATAGGATGNVGGGEYVLLSVGVGAAGPEFGLVLSVPAPVAPAVFWGAPVIL